MSVGREPSAHRVGRYGRHATEVAARWGASRYDDAVERLGPDLDPASWVGVAARQRTPPGDRHDVLVVAPGAAATAQVRRHPSLTLRIARDASDHEQAAVALSTGVGDGGHDLDVVRQVLGPNVAHVDGASRLLALRGEQVVGTVTLVLTEAAGLTVASLQAFAVAPRWRGRGTGLALAARAVELAAGTGAEVVFAEVTPGAAVTLARLGFEPPVG